MLVVCTLSDGLAPVWRFRVNPRHKLRTTSRWLSLGDSTPLWHLLWTGGGVFLPGMLSAANLGF